nr:hypothetical protein [Candidatus Wukongarchaeota archaeon]MDO8128081.1 hypothetical protein [Candidatus Wukongarchaeota archaeon]
MGCVPFDRVARVHAGITVRSVFQRSLLIRFKDIYGPDQVGVVFVTAFATLKTSSFCAVFLLPITAGRTGSAGVFFADVL